MKALSIGTVQVYSFVANYFTLNKGKISLKIIINRTILPISNGVNKPTFMTSSSSSSADKVTWRCEAVLLIEFIYCIKCYLAIKSVNELFLN